MMANRVKDPKDERLFYVNQLKSEECLCGKYKQPGFAFCYGCYKTLPKDHQRALYKKIGTGFEEAYDACAIYLNG